MSLRIPEPLIAVDVGNSRTKLGLFSQQELFTEQGLPTCHEFLPVAHAESLPWEKIRQWTLGSQSVRGLICGTNPKNVERVLSEWPVDWETPLHIENSEDFPLEITVEFPRRVGVDRLLNTIAANAFRKAGEPVIVADCGTATTVDLVSPAGEFAGGAILAGLELSARCLHQYTAKLPLIPVADLAETPDPLGRHTEAAMKSGLFWGQVGAIRELFTRLSQSLPAPARLVLTGGGTKLLAPHFPGAEVRVPLVLQGLVLVQRLRNGAHG